VNMLSLTGSVGDNSFTNTSPRIKALALAALRNAPRADCHVRDEVTELHRGRAILEWNPVRPGTVYGTIGPVAVHDDMDGHLRNEDNYAVADINYVTGLIDLEPTFRVLYDQRYRLSYRFEPGARKPVNFNAVAFRLMEI
jgi:hypothetical protein